MTPDPDPSIELGRSIPVFKVEPLTDERFTAAAKLCSRVIRDYNNLVLKYEAEHELRIRAEVSLRLAREKPAKMEGK